MASRPPPAENAEGSSATLATRDGSTAGTPVRGHRGPKFDMATLRSTAGDPVGVLLFQFDHRGLWAIGRGCALREPGGDDQSPAGLMSPRGKVRSKPPFLRAGWWQPWHFCWRIGRIWRWKLTGFSPAGEFTTKAQRTQRKEKMWVHHRGTEDTEN